MLRHCTPQKTNIQTQFIQYPQINNRLDNKFFIEQEAKSSTKQQTLWIDVLSGIPQGSVLGPLLFVIYVNELPTLVESDLYLFADDAKIFQKISHYNNTLILQKDLDILVNWSNTWLLKVSPDKCVGMTIANKPPKEAPEYHLNLPQQTHRLQWVSNEKDIGVVIDSKLEFDIHINQKINKANQMFSLIRRSFEFLTTKNFPYLYKSLLRNHLEYASSLWSPYKMKHIEAIENVQRRATKQLPQISHLSYPERLKILKLPSLA